MSGWKTLKYLSGFIPIKYAFIECSDLKTITIVFKSLNNHYCFSQFQGSVIQAKNNRNGALSFHKMSAGLKGQGGLFILKSENSA